MDINSYYNCKTMVNIALINFLALELCINESLPGRASFNCFSVNSTLCLGLKLKSVRVLKTRDLYLPVQKLLPREP